MNDQPKIATVANHIQFHGFAITVYEYAGKEYVDFRKFVTALGLNWRSTWRTNSSERAVKRYGIVSMIDQNQANLAQTDGTSATTSDRVFIALNRTRAFMHQLNTLHIRSKGNEETADLIDALQDEWDEVIYQYETQGFAINPRRNTSFREIIQLAQAVNDKRLLPKHRKAIEKLTDETLTAMGLTIEDVVAAEKPAEDQLDLNLN